MKTTTEDSLYQQLLSPLHALKMDAEYHENLFAIAQAKLALDVVESSLLLHKYNSDQLHLELEPVHVGDSVNRALVALRDYFIQQRIEFEIDYSPHVPTTYADRHVLEHSIKMLFYATQSYNSAGSVLRIKATHDSRRQVKLSVVARELETDKIVLRRGEVKTHLKQTPLDTARSLVQVIGGDMRKISYSGAKGFCMTIPASQQLALV